MTEYEAVQVAANPDFCRDLYDVAMTAWLAAGGASLGDGGRLIARVTATRLKNAQTLAARASRRCPCPEAAGFLVRASGLFAKAAIDAHLRRAGWPKAVIDGVGDAVHFLERAEAVCGCNAMTAAGVEADG